MYTYTYMKVFIAQSSPTAIPFFRGSSRLRAQTRVSCIAGRFFTVWASREAVKHCMEQQRKKKGRIYLSTADVLNK